MANQQKVLHKEQIEAFYHDQFVDRQVSDFLTLLGPSIDPAKDTIVDVGGGCGFFARCLKERRGFRVRVLDTDSDSIAACIGAGVEARRDDALDPHLVGDESVVCFNLILHHLVGHSENETLRLQSRALAAWQSKARAVFVNEYIYESYVATDLSAWLIYRITSSSLLSGLASAVARIFPSLKANTFGVGVRFRSNREWVAIFNSLGFDVVDSVTGDNEHISLPRRLLMIKKCRRDSFLLVPRSRV